MASIQERLQLKRVPLDTWNIREQLCLASAVVRSGDQNWMSVSRALKTVGEPNRPPDWYSQKSCAAQYGVLLENVETPKRKKRSSEGAVETPQESILKKLTQERISEIQKTLADMNQQYEQLKNEVTESRNPATSEERLREMWNDIETAKRTRERENAKRAAWLKEREERRARAERTWRPPVSVSSTTTPVPAAVAPAPPASPLLTSLLKSSPVVTTPQHISHPANVVETISPSAGAPTLSMLLEKPGGTSPREKHAAIEHIKSQLVQIERQLKANTSGTIAPAVDIDDIEIKAEDVYAFRDIDLHIPPVMPKPARIVDKPEAKKDEAEPTGDNIPVETVEVKVAQLMEEKMQVDNEVEAVDEVETTPETPPAQPAIEKEEVVPEVKIAFPEVKFPTAEIKVIQSDEEKTKEDKEPETTAEVEKEPEVDVVSETVAEPEVVEQPPTPVQEPAPEPDDEETLDPGSIPLPAEPDSHPEETAVEEEIIATEVTEPPLPPEVEKEEVPETKAEEEVEEESEPTAEVVEKDAEDIKKEDDAEFSSQDSIPLNEMLKEEVEPAQTEEVKERAETEDAHTETDDDTPMELSREEEKDGKKKRDYSRKKKSDSRTCSGSESAAEASAPESPSASDSERLHRLWKKSVMLVYSRLCAHKYASLFLRPITDEEAPGYSAVVRRPMDLSTIRRHIDNGLIRTTAQFQRAVLLMLSNAMMYNSSSHSVHSMARQMFEEAQSQLGMLLAAQAHAGLCDEPPRRKRRRTHEPRPARH